MMRTSPFFRAFLALAAFAAAPHASFGDDGGWLPGPDWRERPDPSASPRARKGGTIRFNAGPAPKSFNAYVDGSSYSSMFFSLMYDRLLGNDPDTMEFAPALARRWRVSSDGREFTFELDARARWSDGSPVTARDVKATFDAVTDPKSDTGPWKIQLGEFASPEILDAHTVRFRKKGDSPRDWRDLMNCSGFWILPASLLEGRDFNSLDFVRAPVGGAYALVRIDEQVEAEYARVASWWRADTPPCRGTYNFDRILARYFADNENAFEALKKRQIDVYPVYTARIMNEGTRSERFRRNWILARRVRNHRPVGYQGFAMNMRRAPFDDRRVRIAMAKLIDRETMNRTMMNGEYFLQNSYFTDIYTPEEPCRNPMWLYDPEGAAKLLAEAGWRRDAVTGRLERDGRPFAFTFLSRSSTEDKFLALFDAALRAQGIEMRIVRKDFSEWMRDMDEFNFDMTWQSWGAGVFKYPEVAWSSSEADRHQSNNTVGFRSAEVDRLIAAEKSMGTMAERVAAYREIDRLVAEEAPFAFLWNSDQTRLLYWNRFGMPETVLSRFTDEEGVLTYWWHDADRAAELKKAMSENGFLPTVPVRVDFDAVRAAAHERGK